MKFGSRKEVMMTNRTTVCHLLLLLAIAIGSQGCSGCARFTIRPQSPALSGNSPSETLGRVHVTATVERRRQLMEPDTADANLEDAVVKVFDKAGYLVVDSAVEADFEARVLADNEKFSRGLSGAWSNARLNVAMTSRDGQEIKKGTYTSKQRGRNSEVAFTGAVLKCLQDFYGDLTSPSWREGLRAQAVPPASPAPAAAAPAAVPAAPASAPAASAPAPEAPTPAAAAPTPAPDVPAQDASPSVP